MFPLGRRLALACAGMAVAAAALSGCGGGGSKPVSLPSISPDPPPTPTASSTQTELDAVSAVVRRYYDLLNGSTSLANATALSKIMTRDCSCQQVVAATRAAAAKHEHFFGRNRLRSIVPNIDGPNDADALVTYDYTRSGLVDASGRVVSSGAGRKGTTQNFRFVRSSGRWLISAILRVSPGKT